MTEKVATAVLHQMVLNSGRVTYAAVDLMISRAIQAGASDAIAKTNARKHVLPVPKICVEIVTRSRVKMMVEDIVAARVLVLS